MKIALPLTPAQRQPAAARAGLDHPPTAQQAAIDASPRMQSQRRQLNALVGPAQAGIRQLMRVNMTLPNQDMAEDVETDTYLAMHIPDMDEAERLALVESFRQARQANSTKPFESQALDAVLTHLRGKRYGAAQSLLAARLRRDYLAITTEPVDLRLPSFQALIKEQLEPLMQPLLERAPLTTGELQNLETRLAAVKLKVDVFDHPDAPRKVGLLSELNKEFAPHHKYQRALQRPTDNQTFVSKTRAHGKYTVGEKVVAAVSSEGASKGSDVNGWLPVSDLNYKYGLLSATKHKLVAAHLLPALMGGRAEDGNLTPVINFHNGKLASGIEQAAKKLVWSGNWPILYTASYEFTRATSAPLEDDVAALIPSRGTVKIEPLVWKGAGDERSWSTYLPISQVPRMPAPDGEEEPPPFGMQEVSFTNDLDEPAMKLGVQRADLDRSKLL